MSEIQNITPGLIPVGEYQGMRVVSGRELHEFLQIGRDYTTWFKQMCEYGFTEGQDYLPIIGEVARAGRGAVQRHDHALTLDMGKELGMIQRTELGRQIRQYFIEMEKRALTTVPDLSTPEGVLALAHTLTQTAEQLVAAKNEVAVLTPLAAQARTHNLGKGEVNRQDFAREIVKWALSEGFPVKQPQVMEFLGRKLDLFVVGHRSDRGDATLSGERRGLSTTEKGVSTRNGHAYSTGKLTPKGVEYAWSRIEAYVREHGHLELPQKGIAA